MEPNGGSTLTKDDARNIVFLLQELSEGGVVLLNSAEVATVRANMLEFIDLQQEEGIPVDVFLRELHSHTLTALTTHNRGIGIDSNAESDDPQFQQYIPQTETAITELVNAIGLPENGEYFGNVDIPPELLANLLPQLSENADPLALRHIDPDAVAEQLFDMGNPEDQLALLASLEPSQRELVGSSFIQLFDHALLIHPHLRQQLTIQTPEDVLESLMRGLSKFAPREQLLLLGSLLPVEQEQLFNILNREENVSHLLGLNVDVRAEFGLSTDDPALWAIFQQQIADKDIGEQLAMAYQALAGWDEQTNLERLNALAAQIETTPTELLGMPIPSVKATYQRYHSAMMRHHNAMVAMKPLVFAAEGEERQNVIQWIEWLREQSGDDEEMAWDEMVLPELQDELLTLDETYANSQFIHPDDATEAFPLDPSDLAPPEELGDLSAYLHDLRERRSTLPRTRDFAVIAASIAFEPVDWILSGYEIGRDVLGSITGRGEHRVGSGTGITFGGLVAPGAFHKADDIAGPIFRGVKPRSIAADRPALDVALRRPMDYLTGLSFWDNLATVETADEGLIGLRYIQDALESRGFVVVRDGGQVVRAVPGTSIEDIRKYATEQQIEIALARIGMKFPDNHVTVYLEDREAWLRWFVDEYTAKQTGGFSQQTLDLYGLGTLLLKE